MKCYILSETNGTFQIGHTVFQPCTGAIFNVDGLPKGWKKMKSFEVACKSMQAILDTLATEPKM